MSESPLRLHFRFGDEIENPTVADVERALAEVFHENHPDLVEGDYVEHPNSWLQYGFENGDDWSLVTVEVYRSRVVEYSYWSDQDDDEPSCEARLDEVSEPLARNLFQLLLNCRLDQLVDEFKA